MKITGVHEERGLAQTAVIAIVVAVLAAAGVAGWLVNQRDNEGGSNSESSLGASMSAADLKEYKDDCKKEYNDEDLCTFFTSWGDIKKFSIESSGSSEGTVVKSTIKIDGDNSYMTAQGAIAYEIITIGGTTYTKAGDTWWKQAAAPTGNSDVNTDDFKFDPPSMDEPEGQKTTYEKQGKETCGDRQCFKYKVVEPDSADSTQHLWFDDKDFLLRKIRSDEANGSYNEQTYAYDNISITEPSPVKELGPNQYIIPGQSEPVELPNMEGMDHGGDGGAAQQ